MVRVAAVEPIMVQNMLKSFGEWYLGERPLEDFEEAAGADF